jgi:TonB-dependent receptor
VAQLISTQMKNFIILIISLLSLTVVAQTGKIAGKVIDKKNNEFVIGAAVVISGTSTGAATDLDGQYAIENVAAGTYKLQVRYLSYKTVEIADVKVVEGKTTTINVSLEPDDDLKLDEVVITTARITNSESAVLLDVKKADQVVVAISSMQIQKSQDRDASEVVKRLPGITVQDDRFIIIRGLNQRYNEVWLNNSVTPSIEPDVKSFSFDLVPSQVIDRILVYKTAAPELPGNFAGGAIKIFTKDIPERNFISGGYTVGFRTGTTFKDRLRQESYSSDKWGFGANERAIPAEYPDTNITSTLPADVIAASKTFKNDWGVIQEKASVDHRASLSGGFKFNIKGVQIGSLGMVNYSNTYMTYQRSILEAGRDSLTLKVDAAIFKDDMLYENNVRFSGTYNFGIKFNENHKIEIKNLYNRTATSTTVERNELNYEVGQERRAYEHRYNSRFIYAGQILGTHQFFKGKTKFDWFASLDKSNRTDPNQRRIRFNLQNEDPSDPNFNKYFLPTTGVDPNISGRFYQNLDENIYVGGFNFDQKIVISPNKFVATLKAGIYIEKKEREFQLRNFAFHQFSQIFGFTDSLRYMPLDQVFRPENFSTAGYRVTETTNGSDSYVAENFLKAYYAGINLNLFEKVTLYGGIRIEDNLQTLNGFDNQASSAVFVNNDILDILPSINISYNLNPKMLVRVAYAKTLNRAEFRELAPFAFLNFDFDALTYGNPNLKNCYIQNIDLRYEWYPSNNETFSAALFYKKFDNPIENILLAGGQLQFTFNNALTAVNYGIELDARISLARYESVKFIRNLSVVANASFIKSQVDLGFTGTSFQRNNRPLQGQSPYVFNTGLYYQNDSINLQFSILYNVFGPRLFMVGDIINGDWFEMPRGMLDISVTKGITKWLSVRLGVQNLINPRFYILSDQNTNGKPDKDFDIPYQDYREGRYFTLGLLFNVKGK